MSDHTGLLAGLEYFFAQFYPVRFRDNPQRLVITVYSLQVYKIPKFVSDYIGLLVGYLIHRTRVFFSAQFYPESDLETICSV